MPQMSTPNVNYNIQYKLQCNTVTCTMVLGLSLSVARTSTTSPAFVPTRIFSPCQHTLRTDRPSGRRERRNISWLTSFWTNAVTQGQNSYPFPLLCCKPRIFDPPRKSSIEWLLSLQLKHHQFSWTSRVLDLPVGVMGWNSGRTTN